MSDLTNIDLPLLKRALRDAALNSRALKRALRRTWDEPMADRQRELVRHRRRTTELCILRALLRGRYHLHKALRAGAWPGMTWDQAEFHQKMAARVALEFAQSAGAHAQPMSAPLEVE